MGNTVGHRTGLKLNDAGTKHEAFFPSGRYARNVPGENDTSTHSALLVQVSCGHLS